jgi:hypothetical protein
MSVPEFEELLSRVTSDVPVSAARRTQIADELRDHLEVHLAALEAAGWPRESAVQQVLASFGPAELLAGGLTQVHHISRRRLIMRCSVAGLVLSLAALLVFGLVWPEPRLLPVASLVVADDEDDEEVEEGANPNVAPNSGNDEDLEARLERRVTLKLMAVPLADALEYLSREAQVDILINHRKLEEAGIDPNPEITLELKFTRPTVRAALEILLEQHGLAYTTREDLIMVTSAADAESVNQVGVYKVSDLIGDGQEAAAGGHPAVIAPGTVDGAAGTGWSDGSGRVPAGRRATRLTRGMAGGAGLGGGSMMAGAMGGGMMTDSMLAGGGGVPGTDICSTSLAEVIERIIAPDSWNSVGGAGSIVQYHDLLIVKNAPQVHLRIRHLLLKMRNPQHD